MMRSRATTFLLLSICLSNTLLAQEGPELFSRIEQVFREKEPAWRAERPLTSETSERIRRSLMFRSGRLQASVHVAVWGSEKGARDAFAEESRAFGNRAGQRMVRGGLPGLGDENYIWANRRGVAMPVIKFRKGNVVVTVLAPSAAVAERFARHVLQQVAASEQGHAPDRESRRMPS